MSTAPEDAGVSGDWISLQRRREDLLRTASDLEDAQPGSGEFCRGMAQGHLEAMHAMEFAATIGMDALRIATLGKPLHHDVETICRWLRHVSASNIKEQP